MTHDLRSLLHQKADLLARDDSRDGMHQTVRLAEVHQIIDEAMHDESCPTLGDWDSRRGVEPPCDCDRLRFEARMRSVDIPALAEAIRVHYATGRHGYSLAACAGAIAAEYAVLTPKGGHRDHA